MGTRPTPDRRLAVLQEAVTRAHARIAELERERDDAKRGWDSALAATHDLARQIGELLKERDAAQATIRRLAKIATEAGLISSE